MKQMGTVEVNYICSLMFTIRAGANKATFYHSELPSNLVLIWAEHANFEFVHILG